MASSSATAPSYSRSRPAAALGEAQAELQRLDGLEALHHARDRSQRCRPPRTSARLPPAAPDDRRTGSTRSRPGRTTRSSPVPPARRPRRPAAGPARPQASLTTSFGREVVRALHHDVVPRQRPPGRLPASRRQRRCGTHADVRVELFERAPERTSPWAGRGPWCRAGSGAGGWTASTRVRVDEAQRARRPPRPGRARPASPSPPAPTTQHARAAGGAPVRPPPTSGRIICRL